MIAIITEGALKKTVKNIQKLSTSAKLNENSKIDLQNIGIMSNLKI